MNDAIIDAGGKNSRLNSFGYFLETLREKPAPAGAVDCESVVCEDPQFKVLGALSEAPGPRPISEMAAASRLPPTLFFQALDTMKAYGLIRQSGEKGEFIEATDCGRKMLESYRKG